MDRNTTNTPHAPFLRITTKKNMTQPLPTRAYHHLTQTSTRYTRNAGQPTLSPRQKIRSRS